MWEYKQYHDKTIGKFDNFILRLRDLQTLKMIKSVGDCSSVIEVGPGRGTFGELCLDNGISYIAIEASSIGVNRVRNKGLTVYHGLFPKCKEDLHDKFDVFMARSVLEHVADSVHASEFIQEAAKCVKRGGLLFIEAPDIRFWKWNYWIHDYGHNYICSLRRIKQLMQEYDLDVLKSGTRSQFICNPFDWIFYLLSYLPIGKKLKTSFLPCAYVIARKGNYA